MFLLGLLLIYIRFGFVFNNFYEIYASLLSSHIDFIINILL